MKKQRGDWYTFPHSVGGIQPKICSFSPPGKKFPLPHGKFPRLLSSALPNTKFLFPQASKPKSLNYYGQMEKQHWGRTIFKGAWAGSQKSQKCENYVILPVLANSPSYVEKNSCKAYKLLVQYLQVLLNFLGDFA